MVVFKCIGKNAEGAVIFRIFEVRHKFVAQAYNYGFPSGFFQCGCPVKNIIYLLFAQRLAGGRFFNEVFNGVGSVAPHISVPENFAFKQQGIFAVIVFQQFQSLSFVAGSGQSFGADDAALQLNGFRQAGRLRPVENVQSFVVLTVKQLD